MMTHPVGAIRPGVTRQDERAGMTEKATPRLRPMGLAARMILFLTLALVPIGVVAYFQTAKLQEETRLRSQLSLVALTEAAAVGERQTVLRAQGGAQALGATLGHEVIARGDAETCSARLAAYLAASPGYSYGLVLTAMAACRAARAIRRSTWRISRACRTSSPIPARAPGSTAPHR